MDQAKIIILDFTSGEIHIFTYDKQICNNDPEEFLTIMNEEEGYNFSISNCEYMIVEELKLFIH